MSGIEKFGQLQLLDIRGNQIDDVSVLEKMPTINSIYVDDNFDREQLDFLVGKFRDADPLTRAYLLKKQHNLE